MILSLRPEFDSLPEQTAFFGSDPAAVRAAMAMAALTARRHPDARLVLFTNRPQHAQFDFPGEIRVIERPDSSHLSGVSAVFCGTSHQSSAGYFELHAIRAARQAGVRSIAFVDHWTNFRLRFTDHDAAVAYPDEIWVIDDHAERLAIFEGLPRSVIRVSGSPFLSYLSRLWKPSLPPSLARSTVLAAAGPCILYAPDPISLREPNAEFNEVTGAEDLAWVVSNISPMPVVVVQLHPLQPKAAGMAIMERFRRRNIGVTLTPASMSGLDAVTVADVVVGFYSNFLMESCALESHVVRYLAPTVHDPLGHLAFLPATRSREDLLQIVRELLARPE